MAVLEGVLALGEVLGDILVLSLVLICSKGEVAVLEGVVALGEDLGDMLVLSLVLICSRGDLLEGVIIHDLRGMEEAECCWLKERRRTMHGRREERRRDCWLTGSG